ncbi:protein PFC0760c-like, partial [Temnothorax curvispinosus]|uniref:Protein PFC0760c-like n=1 Tax=Temnothorax curvispinosus TaxID=300111 RepID=A0A6J1QBL5_9HYME
GKCDEQNRDNRCNILTQLTQNKINPNNVKLLTDDNAGLDFLTLCAVKKSEEEMSSEAVPEMDTTYIPAPKPIKDLFNFVVPNIEILNSLAFLTEDNLTQCKDNEDENIYDANDCINVDDDNVWCTIRNEKSVDNGEIRFEDILDESSDSNEAAVSYLNHLITDMEINSINTNKASTSEMKENNEIITGTNTELSTNALEDLEPSIFENILNESFSSVEDDLEDKDDTAMGNTESPNSSNVSIHARETNVTHETNVDTFHNEDNVAKTNQNLSSSMKLVEPYQMKKIVSFIDEIQDVDFNSDDDISEFVKYDSNKNRSMRNSKTEESLLSITQAIGEIARGKKHLETSRTVSKEESTNEESSGWISVNTKNEIKVGKSDTSSRTDN